MEAHRYAAAHLESQHALKINEYILSSILTLVALFLLLRIFFVKDKGFLLIMVILLLLANSLAITGSNIEDKINILLADPRWERN